MEAKALIDEATIRELRQAVGDDYLPELIQAYLEETPKLLKELETALAAGEVHTFTRAAHSIKSSSASLGALDFAAQAKELELIGKSGDLSLAGDPLSHIAAGYPALEMAFRGYL